ncbi:lectin [Streptacidiphilus pinicola]|uniref:Lectin n=1 Tax=Streptacidiphilus pinicola TaxID=2219663 RepID=A0A2X0JGA5_9ACTN|nr:RICIN domain-containing protein [Streptacidiphilus pinicola]RAG86668.1 lectin [Streptacidiphilus pinicola]
MDMPNVPLGRRRFLVAAALTAGATALPAVFTARASAAAPVPPGVTLPRRGIWDSASASSWTDGFVSGNGEFGAVFHGAPTLEKVILTCHHFVLPNGTRDLQPPVVAAQLATSRSQALAGNYAQAAATLDHGWQLRWTQTFHPSHELQISTPGMTTADNYARTTDFQTGEVGATWSDSSGTWLRHGFVSRADKVVVHELLPASGQTLSATLSVNTALDGVPGSVAFTTTATVANGDGYLDLRGIYPAGGAYGFEGTTRIVPIGGSVTANGQTVTVSGASRLLLLSMLGRYENATDWNAHPLQTALARLTADYATLLTRHSPLHAAMFNRSSIDLDVPAADRALATSDLIARQNANRGAVDVALLERMYDSGRYVFVSSCGVLPPRLTGLWTGTWSGSWADDFTTDANVNLQVAGGNILDLSDAMQGYFDLVLGQLPDWQTNARNIYGCRGYLAPTRTDGEYGHMLHFDSGGFPGEAWTGGADWLLWPLLEYYQVTGDSTFLQNKLGPALMTLALFYEDFLTTTDKNGKAVFVPSFSPENQPAGTGQSYAVNATVDIAAARHALQAAIDAADTLGVEQGSSQGVQRWTALLARLPAYTVNSDHALAEWSWPGLTDHYDHRHISHLYGAWPLHEINPEDNPALVQPALRALDLRGDENLAGHGSLHRALARARLKDGTGVYTDLLKILGNDMVFRGMITSHYPDLSVYNCDVANTLPAVLAEALVYTRPGILELLPALPYQLAKGAINGIRGRNRVHIQSLTWDTTVPTATVTLTSDIDQTLTVICRRGINAVTSSAPVTSSPLGADARRVTLTAGTGITLTLSLGPSTLFRVVNRRSGLVLDASGASTADGGGLIQWSWSGGPNQQWRQETNADGSFRLRNVNSGLVLDSPGGSGEGTQLDQWTDSGSDNQWWKLAPTSGGYGRLVNVRTGWCADAQNGSTAAGTPIIQWAANGGSNQEWQLVAL